MPSKSFLYFENLSLMILVFIIIIVLLILILIYQAFSIREVKKKFEQHDKKSSEIKEEKVYLLIILLSIVFLLWISSWILIDYFIEEEQRGIFGDKFGSTNALFSGFALAGIIYTIFLQKKELALQREELEETRKEFQTQNVTLKKQRFENTFFQLLKLHNDIVENLEINVFDGTYEKRKFFEGAIKQLKYRSTNFPYYKYSFTNKLSQEQIRQTLLDNAHDFVFLKILDEDETKQLRNFSLDDYTAFLAFTATQKEEFIKNDYTDFFSTYQDNLGHYFRNLYHIFKYVYLTDLIKDSEKRVYCNIVRAQLSSDELILMFYNSITPIHFSVDRPTLGYPKFKFLIDEFDLLQNMNPHLLLDPDHLNIFIRNTVENPFR